MTQRSLIGIMETARIKSLTQYPGKVADWEKRTFTYLFWVFLVMSIGLGISGGVGNNIVGRTASPADPINRTFNLSGGHGVVRNGDFDGDGVHEYVGFATFAGKTYFVIQDNEPLLVPIDDPIDRLEWDVISDSDKDGRDDLTLTLRCEDGRHIGRKISGYDLIESLRNRRLVFELPTCD